LQELITLSIESVVDLFVKHYAYAKEKEIRKMGRYRGKKEDDKRYPILLNLTPVLFTVVFRNERSQH